ncbi:MAG: enoyl-CoA hydratase/isomerase family protein, partial [Acidimicrobiia bacterium]
MADLDVRDADGVHVVILSRPDSLNALTLELLDELFAALDRAQSVGAPVVITGSGRAFCAGADLAAIADPPSSGTLGSAVARRMQTHFNEVPRRIASLGVPVVAAVNGVTAGGGIGLALA